jgi:hypothetical protein
VSIESPFRQHAQFDLEQDHKMNDDITSRVLAIEAPGRYEVSSFARKRASPAEQPRELIDRIPMSETSSVSLLRGEV